MSTKPDDQKTELTDMVKAVGAVLGVALALFTIVNSSIAQPITSLVVALIAAVLVSAWLVFSRWFSITQVITAWLALAVVVLAGFVIWPRTMTVEGVIYDTVGNPVRDEQVILFDRSGRRYETKTEAEGYYQFIDVPSGKYRVQVRTSQVEGETEGILVRVVQQKLTVPEITLTASPTSVAAVTPNTPTATPIPPTNTFTPEPPTGTFTSTLASTLPPMLTDTLSPTDTVTPTPTSTNSPTPLPTNTPTPLAPPTATSTTTSIATSVRVDARMNIYGADKLIPPDPAGGGGGKLPAEISFPAQPGQTLIISSVEGTVSGYSDGCGYNGADGGPFCTGKTHIKDYGGISGIVHGDKTMFLVGVFLDDTGPTDPAPKTLGYTEETDDLEEVVSPLLNQVFFIGDGQTPSKTVQRFEIPPDATRLCLGFAETNDFGYSGNPGLPGYYDDNGGGLTVSLEIRR